MATPNDKRAKPEASDNRHHGNSFVYIGTIVILVITTIAFVFMPAMGGASSGGGELTFGTWNGKPISFVQGGYFSGQVQQIKSQLESQGYKDTGDQYFAFQVWRRAFENTAVHYALLDDAAKAGIAVSDSYIDDQMVKNPAFMDNGTFSKRKYREASTTIKLSLRRDIQDSALKNKYVSDAVAFIPSKAETAFLSSLAQSRRVVEYVAFPFSAYPDSERIAYAKANPALFRRVRLSRITLSSSLKETEQVLAQVKSGALSFEEAAKSHSKDSYAPKGGDVGARYVWELKGELKDPANLDAVLALGKGDLSPVYETLAGSWIFFRVDETAVDPDFASADLARTVTDYLNRNEKGRIEDWALAQAAKFASSIGTDFDTAAAKQGLTVRQTDPFPLNYGNALDVGYFSLLGSLDTTNLPELKGADRNESFLTAIFSLKAGEVSKPLAINDFAIVARVKEIVTAQETDLGLLQTYYPTVMQQGISNDLAASILVDPRLKDNFMAAFTKVYATTN